MSNLLFDPIRTQSKVCDSVLVAFSGGKDAIITLDLCMRNFKNVQVFFMYMVKDIKYINDILKRYEDMYGIKIIQVPHPDVSAFYKYGMYTKADPNVKRTTINETYDYVRGLTGIEWIAGGERTTDSIERNARIKNSSSIDFKSKRFFPIAYWTKKDVYEYIRVKKLYLPRINKEFGCSTDALHPIFGAYIKEHYPEDYAKIVRAFPHYESAVFRYEKYGMSR